MCKFLYKEIELVQNHDVKDIDLHIAFTIDQSFIKAVGVSIYSILENNKNLNIKFHIFTTCEDEKIFNDFLSFNTQITLYILNKSYFNRLKTTNSFSAAIYYRIVIPNILYAKADQILYIDADILCVGDLSELSKIKLQNEYIACVKDLEIRESYKNIIGLSREFQYFNSGVMLININKWMNDKIYEKFMEVVNKYDFSYPDQDALNIIFQENKLLLDQKYNQFREKNVEDSVFLHYVGWLKPWHLGAYDNKLYLHYYFKSPFANYLLDQPKSYKYAKKIAKRYLDNGKRMIAMKWYLIYFLMKFKLK